LIIGIDVESGERHFSELIDGVLRSTSKLTDIKINIIGKKNNILSNYPNLLQNKQILLTNADEVVNMDESPVSAVRKKRDSTVVVGTTLLKNNEIDCFFSPGNTGATVASSIFSLNTIIKSKKPALSASFPSKSGHETILIDIGANPELTEDNLFNNAILGLAYYSILWDKPYPTIGLLNIGSEHGKGSKILKNAYDLISKIPSFIGNIEGYNLFNGSVDIAICDGLTGNSIIKMAESMTAFFMETISESFSVKDNKEIMQKLYPRFFGGAPLLGVDGLVIVGHGNCTGKDIENAIELAYFLHNKNYIIRMRENIEKLISNT